jgi:hypothetical protein
MSSPSLRPINVMYYVGSDVPYQADKITNSPNYQINCVDNKIKSVTICGVLAIDEHEAMAKAERELERILAIICLGTMDFPKYNFQASFPWDKGGLSPAIAQIRRFMVPAMGVEPIDLNRYESKKTSPKLNVLNLYYVSRYLYKEGFIIEAYLNLILTLENLKPNYKGTPKFEDFGSLRDAIVHPIVTFPKAKKFALLNFKTNSIDWRDQNNINKVEGFYKNLDKEVQQLLKALL